MATSQSNEQFVDFYCPYCGRKTRINKTRNPFGKGKKCRGCNQIYDLVERNMKYAPSKKIYADMLAVGEREMYIEDTMESAQPQYAPVARQERTYDMRVGFWPRLLAFFVDSVMLTALTIFIVVAGRASTASSLDPNIAIGKILWVFAVLCLAILFYWLIEGVSGASPGKMIVGLKIAMDHGQKARLNRYLLRYLCKNSGQLLAVMSFIIPGATLDFAAGIFALVLFIGSFWIFSSKKQTLWDHWSHTAVFYRRELVKFQEQHKGMMGYPNANIAALIFVLLLLMTIGLLYRTHTTIQMARIAFKQSQKDRTGNSIVGVLQQWLRPKKSDMPVAPALTPAPIKKIDTQELVAYRKLEKHRQDNLANRYQKLISCGEFCRNYPVSKQIATVKKWRQLLANELGQENSQRLQAIESLIAGQSLPQAWQACDDIPLVLQNFAQSQGLAKLPQLREKIVSAALAALAEEKRHLENASQKLTAPGPSLAENWSKASIAYRRFLENNRLIAESVEQNQASRQKLFAELAEIKTREQQVEKLLHKVLTAYQKYMTAKNYRRAIAILKKWQSHVHGLRPARLRKIPEQYIHALIVEQKSLKKLFGYLGQQIEHAGGLYRTLNISGGRSLSGTIHRYHQSKVYLEVARGVIVGQSIYTINARDLARFVPEVGNSPQLDYAIGVLYFYEGLSEIAEKYFARAQKNGYSAPLPRLYHRQQKIKPGRQ